MIDPLLGPHDYLLGAAWVFVSGAALAVAGIVVRRQVLPTLPPSAGVVGGAVTALALLVLVGELLGSVGLLRAAPVLVGVVMASAGVAIAARRAAARQGPERPHPERPQPVRASPAMERCAATVAVVAVGAQWVDHVVDALARGMTHADTLWYHAPYSARFLQMHGLGDLGELGYGQARFYPLGSELLHAIVALPFQRDLLSPFLNLGFAALAVVAAAAIGARWGVGALAVLGTAAVLGLPTLGGTQPGQASNDVVAIALVLAAVAMVLHAEHRRGPMAVGGLALGMAAGTKMTVLALAGPLGLVVLLCTLRAGHRASAGSWLGGILATAAYWPIRNIALTGTPVPFLDFEIGPWHHVATTSTGGTPTLLATLIHGARWSYWSGLTNGFGPLWPVLLLALLGGLVALWGPGSLRGPAVAAVVGSAAYPITPFTGDSTFQYNLRYLTPALALSTVLLTVVVAPRPRTRIALGAGMALVLLVNLFVTHHERTPGWPGHWWAVVGVVAVVSGFAVLVRRARSRRSRLAVGAAACVTCLLAGWPVQIHYLERRYAEAGLPDDPLNGFFRTVSGAHVDVLGTPETYPMFGADLTNVVRNHSDRLLLDQPWPEDVCRYWRRELQGADLVALSSFGFAMHHLSPEDRHLIFETDPAVSVRFNDGARTVYEIDGALDPSRCPEP